MLLRFFGANGFNFCWNQLIFCCYGDGNAFCGDSDGEASLLLLEPVFCFVATDVFFSATGDDRISSVELSFLLETVVHAYDDER